MDPKFDFVTQVFFASQGGLEVMSPWWVRIPTRDLTDVTLVSEDTDEDDEDDIVAIYSFNIYHEMKHNNGKHLRNQKFIVWWCS